MTRRGSPRGCTASPTPKPIRSSASAWPEGETAELQPETLEGAPTVGGNAVFPAELTLAVSSALRKLTADQIGSRMIL